jgi:hypothetical protein
MSINLSSLTSIQSALFCRMDVPGYQVLRFSSFNRVVNIDGEDYTGLGTLLGVTDTSNDLRVTNSQFTITISGIPDSSINEILNNRIKGSAIQVWRVFFDPATGEILDIPGNPLGRFQGIVNNYSLEEDWSQGSLTTTNTILITCSSTVDVLSNKISGRKTNSTDEKALYPTDVSMDRVAKLTNSNFNFGVVVN